MATTLPLSAHAAPAPCPSPQAPPPRRLDALRRVAMQTRLARRMEPERDCALLAGAPEDAAAAYASALLRFLPIALGRRVAFHRPGATPMTFDEAWLLRVIGAVREGDGAGVHFSIASRVPPARRRPLRFLLDGLARRLDGLDPCEAA